MRYTFLKTCGLAVLLVATAISHAQPIKLHPENGHYFLFEGKPTILITAGEHYGALINLDFDYIPYLDALKTQGMNSTRVFAGSYIEREEDIPWMKYENTLAPRPGRLIVPWARGSEPGYANGGNKFDLDQWDPQYFERLKDLIKEAGKRGIVVELTFFGNQYKDGIWGNSPLHPNNNIQGIGPSGKNSFREFQTLHDRGLLTRQEQMVKRTLEETNAFDNLYYEISNEPYNDSTHAESVNQWHAHMAQFISDIEKTLPKKHLIATNESSVDNPNVSVANYHYVRVKNMPDFNWLLSLKKVLSMDETNGSLMHSDADDVRVEAWDFIFRGGGAYNNLSWEHTPSAEGGTPGAETIRTYLKNLHTFFSGFDFVKFRDQDILVRIPDDSFTYARGVDGKEYAFYIHHSKIIGKDWIVSYDAILKEYKDEMEVMLPKGRFKQEWYNPSNGMAIGKPVSFSHKGGPHVFTTPVYKTDIALRLKVVAK